MIDPFGRADSLGIVGIGYGCAVDVQAGSLVEAVIGIDCIVGLFCTVAQGGFGQGPLAS